MPGGVKRSENEVKDDGSFSPKKLNQSDFTKLIKDHKSNIDCLPGKLKNDEQYIKTRAVSSCKYVTNDVFNKKPPKINLKENKIQKKHIIDPDLTAKSNNFGPKGKSRRPDYIRNAMESQIHL